MSLKILYAAGPGDVANTFREWSGGRSDGTEVAGTYSGLFFDLCRQTGATAWVRSTCARCDRLCLGSITVDQRPAPLAGAGGLGFHLSELSYATQLLWRGIRMRADVAIVGGMVHWWALAPMKWVGIEVVPTLHCAFWARGHRPSGRKNQWIQKLNGWFWRRIAGASIAVSPECERQVYEIAGQPRGPVFQSRAQYRRGALDRLAEPDWHERPFQVMYAGRIEEVKGVFLLLEVIAEIQRRNPGSTRWVFCGAGSQAGRFRDQIKAMGLESIAEWTGKLDQSAMHDRYAASHLVVVPTTAGFAEGLNKVAVEGVLSGRPVVTSEHANADDVLGEAVVLVPSGSVDGYVEAIIRLMTDEDLYRICLAAGRVVSEPFYDPDCGWGAAAKAALRHLGLWQHAPESTTEPAAGV